jgi:ubiquinone/menaquinone biosynthesis C-methylase UbiE
VPGRVGREGGEWEWDATLFAGVAEHYDRGRLPNSPGLADALASALRLDGRGRLLDVGCGPGTVTLPFAPLFEAAVGVDADAGMIREAARLATEQGVANASWVTLRAEHLPAGLGGFRVVSFAASFHWMDRPLVAAKVRPMLDPGGVVVHVDNRHQSGLVPSDDHPPVPRDQIDDLRRAYLGADRRAGRSVRNSSPDNEAAVLRGAGFAGPEVVVVPDGRTIVRTTDDIVSEVFSMSSTAPHLFGARRSEFESDLRGVLAEISPAGRFAVGLPDNVLNIWRASVG